MPAAGAMAGAVLLVALLLPWITITTPDTTETSNALGYAASIWGVVVFAALIAAATACLQQFRGRQPLYGLLYLAAASTGGWKVEAEARRIDFLDSVTVFGQQVAEVDAGAGLLLARTGVGLLGCLGLASALALLLQWSRGR